MNSLFYDLRFPQIIATVTAQNVTWQKLPTSADSGVWQTHECNFTQVRSESQIVMCGINTRTHESKRAKFRKFCILLMTANCTYWLLYPSVVAILHTLIRRFAVGMLPTDCTVMLWILWVCLVGLPRGSHVITLIYGDRQSSVDCWSNLWWLCDVYVSSWRNTTDPEICYSIL